MGLAGPRKSVGIGQGLQISDFKFCEIGLRPNPVPSRSLALQHAQCCLLLLFWRFSLLCFERAACRGCLLPFSRCPYLFFSRLLPATTPSNGELRDCIAVRDCQRQRDKGESGGRKRREGGYGGHAMAMAGSATCPSTRASYQLSVSYSCSRKGLNRLGSRAWLLGLRRQRSRFLFPRLSLCMACFSQIQFRKHFIAGNAGVRSNDQQFKNSGVFRSWNQHPLTRFEAWDSSMDAGVTSAAQTTVDEEFTDSNMSSMNGSKPDPYIVVNLGSVSRRVPFQRLAVWTAVVFTMFQLRDFVGIIMGTVVLSVIGNSVVSWAEDYLPGRRRLLVATMYVVILAALIGVGVMYIPRLTQEGARLIARIQTEDPYTLVSDKLRSALGENVTDQLERFLLVMTKPDTVVMESVAGSRTQRLRALQQMIKEYAGAMVVWLATLISATSRFALQSLVSLIFSFMLVWDMPAIRRGVQSLKQSRLSIVYEEIAPVIGTFGAIFGKAMQAQSAIAVVNTALTALGLLVLQVSGVGFLSVLVFLCSFVPVAGVIISTVPIGLVAFTESGLLQLGLVVLMVILIHAVEAYILNPVIYSAHLKLHPLLALGVLVFAEHTLGVWGLLVAVPMAVFFSEYIIKRNSMTMGEDNKYRALPSVPS
ncbi:unnamed protein product [Sphagnum jensenii]|uniref:AI-2E family transporter n=1 Tax=Sphagnum jensenii TaxID=128206 RepID=A0ABP1C2Z9_9BRYO